MLGLGVDDMFLFIRTLMHIKTQPKYKHMSPERLVTQVLVDAGPTVALTTLTNFCAFMIGAITPLPVVQSFAYTASVTVLTCFFTDLVGFPCLCVIALKWYPDFALCSCLPCFKIKARSKSSANIDAPGDEAEADGGWVSTKVVPFLTNKIVRICIVLFSAVLLAVFIFGTTRIGLGLSQKQIAKDGTQPREFINVRDEYFAFYPASGTRSLSGLLWPTPQASGTRSKLM